MLWTQRGAAEWVRNKFWPLWWRVSLSIRVYTTLNQIRFVFYHNIKHNEINFCLDSWKQRLGFESAWAALCKWAACTRQTFLLKPFALICRNNTTKNVWKKSNEAYSLSIIVQTTINHISISFFTTISTSKKMFFFRARAGKGIAWHIDELESSVVWTLIYLLKLANQIARLAAIVVKKDLFTMAQ